MSNQLLKEYKNKLKLLESYNKHYYQNQKPLIIELTTKIGSIVKIFL